MEKATSGRVPRFPRPRPRPRFLSLSLVPFWVVVNKCTAQMRKSLKRAENTLLERVFGALANVLCKGTKYAVLLACLLV